MTTIAVEASPKLSNTKKLCEIYSFSTRAGTDCRWSEFAVGFACTFCYAYGVGRYKSRAVKDLREHNAEDIFRKNWVRNMIWAIDRVTPWYRSFFRWFDSGDIRNVREARLIYRVMRDTPWIKHWLPTRSWRSASILPVLNKMEELPNVVVRFSGRRLNTLPPIGKHRSMVYTDPAKVPASATICRAYDRGRDGRCGYCRQCWDKSVKWIVQPLMGERAEKEFGTIGGRLAV